MSISTDIRPGLKGVLFDLYGTLVRDAAGSEELDAKLLQAGLTPDSEEFFWLSRAVAQAPLALALGADVTSVRDLHLTRRCRDVRELATGIPAAPGTRITNEHLRLVEEMFDCVLDCARLEDGAVALLEELKAAGVRLALVSNVNSFMARVVERLGLDRWFSVTIFSCDLGVTKPSPRAFAAALSGLGVEPSGAVMVGDSWTCDIVGALRCGMRGVWIDRGKDPLAYLIAEGRWRAVMSVNQDGRRALPDSLREVLPPWLPMPLGELEASLTSNALHPGEHPLPIFRRVARVERLTEVAAALAIEAPMNA
jgi:HAD superfamily hydrolase (TIGR01549 family)